MFPVTHTENELSNRFHYEFAPYSVTFIELAPAHRRQANVAGWANGAGQTVLVAISISTSFS